MLKKACYSDKSSEINYAKEINEIKQLNKNLQQAINFGFIVYALKHDPYDMTEEEFDNFYDSLRKEYEEILMANTSSIDEESYKELSRSLRIGKLLTPSTSRILNIRRETGNCFTNPKRLDEFSISISTIKEIDQSQNMDDI